MVRFDDIKNNQELIKKYLKKMGAFSENSPISEALLEVQEAASQEIQINLFLKILDYIFFEYSKITRRQLINQTPNICGLNDQEFLEKCLIFIRKNLNIDLKLTVQQFLNPTKYYAQKLSLIAQCCKRIYEKEEPNQTMKKNQFQKNQSKFQELDHLKSEISRMPHEEEDQEQPRNFNVEPTLAIKKQKKNTSFEVPQTFDKKPTISLSRENNFDLINSATEKVAVQKLPDNLATKEDLSEVMEMLGSLNYSINSVTQKFTTFQNQVNKKFTNLQAKVVLLQNKLKIVSDNL